MANNDKKVDVVKEEEVKAQTEETTDKTSNTTEEKDNNKKSSRKKKASAELEKKDKEIEDLRYKMSDINDKYIRLSAEFDNYRKRTNTTTTRANKAEYDLLRYIYLKHKDINIAHYEAFIDQMLAIIEKEEKEKLKNRERLEFKVGKAILKPLRLIKSVFK